MGTGKALTKQCGVAGLSESLQMAYAISTKIYIQLLEMGALKVNAYEVRAYLDFHETPARLHGSKSLLTLYQIINKT